MPAKWTPVPKEKPDSRWEVFLDEADAKKEAVGTGGFGEVFRGKDKGETRTERKDCAAKKVNVSAPQDRESFVTERTVAAPMLMSKYNACWSSTSLALCVALCVAPSAAPDTSPSTPPSTPLSTPPATAPSATP